MDMKKDLKPGDRLKRVSSSNTLKNGQIYTFKCYSSDGDIMLEGFSEEYHGEYFEFIGSTTSTFEHAKVGDSIWSTGYGDGKVISVDKDSKNVLGRFIDRENDAYEFRFTFEGVANNAYQVLRTVFHSNPNIIAPVVTIDVKDALYIDKFIEAMKVTAKEYIDNTHNWDAKACALCKTVCEIFSVESPDTAHCNKVCPWVIITGKRCNQSKIGTPLERAAELLEWIKTYEQKKLDK